MEMLVVLRLFVVPAIPGSVIGEVSRPRGGWGIRRTRRQALVRPATQTQAASRNSGVVKAFGTP
jgi:hypothetical protein